MQTSSKHYVVTIPKNQYLIFIMLSSTIAKAFVLKLKYKMDWIPFSTWSNSTAATKTIELKLQPAKCELLAQINSYNLKENILLY